MGPSVKIEGAGEGKASKKGAEKDKNNPRVEFAQINDPRNTSAIRIVDQE